MNENDVLFQKVTQAYSEKKIRVLLSGVEDLPITSSDALPLFFFSEYACVTFWNNTSFSFIHQAGNIPSHLFQEKINRKNQKTSGISTLPGLISELR